MEGKFKVGDKVRIKSLDWYNSNKDEEGNIECGYYKFVKTMIADCGKEFTIIKKHNPIENGVVKHYYDCDDDECGFLTDEMIEKSVEN